MKNIPVNACAMFLIAAGGVMSVHAVDLNGQDLTVTTLDAAGYSNSGAAATLTMDLASDVVYAGVVGANVNVVKKGAGTLTLSSKWSSCPSLTIATGCVTVPDPTYLCVAKGALTLDGGIVRFTSTCSWAQNAVPVLTVKFNSEGTIDVPSGVTQTFPNWQSFIAYPHATLHLTGDGTAYLSGRATNAQCGDGILDARCGTLRNGNQVFGAAYDAAVRTTLRLGEGVTADVLENRFMTWPRYVILKGATVVASGQTQNYTNALGRLAKTFEGLTLGEHIVVEPSTTPSRLRVYEAALAPKTAETVFDVKQGATLEVYSRLTCGRATEATARTAQGFVKTGGGVLAIYETMNVDGLVHVVEGTLVLSRAAYLSCAAQLKCDAGASVRLADGALLSAAVQPDTTRDPFLATAKVWLDATRLPYANGQSVPAVANLGLAGGSFHHFTKGTNDTPNAPTMELSGINGKPSLLFQGAQGLVLDAYTNKTQKIHVFLAYQPTDVSGTYRTSFPLTLCCADGGTVCHQQTDNGTAGVMNGHVVFAPQADWRIVMADHGARRYTLDWTSTGVAQDAPIVLEHLRDGTYKDQNVGGKVFYGETGSFPESGFKTSNSYSVTQDIEQVAIGCRLLTDGSAAAKFYGRVGEVLVFDEYLTGDKRTYVENYLRNKWLGAAQTLPTLSGYVANAVTNLVIEIPEGRASFAAATSGNAPTEANTVAKTGAGEMVYAGAAPDLTKLAIAEGTATFVGAQGGSAAAVWIDASDAATVTTQKGSDNVTRVVRLANKGAAGGAFAQNPHYDAAKSVTTPVACPAYATGEEGINGRAALSFDWFSALSTEAYTNRNAETCGVCIYGVCERSDWQSATGKGSASGPFSMTRLDTDDNDAYASCGAHAQDIAATTRRWHCVSGWFATEASSRIAGCVDTGTPYLFALRCGVAGLQITEHAVRDDALVQVAGYNVIRDNSGTYASPTIDIIQLGGRINGRGVPFCPTDKSASLNRMWNGKLGEFLVFDHRLCETEETELCAYLAKKWFGVGAGSTEPPAFLTGRAAAPSFRADTTLALADGVSVRVETTEAVSVETLVSEGVVSVLTRRARGQMWRPLFAFGTFDGNLNDWSLSDARSQVRCMANVIGIVAKGMALIYK